MKNFSKYSRRGLPEGPNEIIEYMTGAISTDGYKFDSEDVDNDFNIILSGDITMEDVDFPVFGMDNLGNSQIMMPGGEYQFPGDMVFELPMAQKGMEVPEREGVRLNYDEDGNVIGESTHLMRTEQLPNGAWVVFPSLFQDEDGTWIDMSEKGENWMSIYEEAKKRGEVINFGNNMEDALEFGAGSWKDQLPEYQNYGTVDDFRGFVKTPYIFDEDWVEREYLSDPNSIITTNFENLGVDVDKIPGFYYQYDVNNPDNPDDAVFFPFDELGRTGLADLNTQYTALPTTVIKPDGKNYLSLPYGIRKKNKNKTVDIDLAEDYDPDVPGSGGTAVYDPQGNFLGWDYKSDQRLAAEKVMNNPNLSNAQKRRLLRRIENNAILDFASPGGGRTYIMSGMTPSGGKGFIDKYWAGMSDDRISEMASNTGFFPGAEEESVNELEKERLERWKRENQAWYDKHFGWAEGFKEDIGYPIARALAMTPAIIAGGPAAVNAGRATLGGISTALNTPLISSAPYVTAGNALNTYFGTDFLFNRADKIPGLIADEEYGEAAKEGFFGGLDLLGLGAVAKSKRAYDLGRNLVNTVDDIGDVVRTTDNYFPGYSQTYNRADLKKNLNEIFQSKPVAGSASDLKTKVDIGSDDPLALANQDYFRRQGITNINTVGGAEDLARYQQTPDYVTINKSLGNYLETGEITPELGQFLQRNRNINLQSLTSKSSKPITGSRIGADELTLVRDGDQIIPKRLSELEEGDIILDLKPTSFSDVNAPGYQVIGSNYQGPVEQITNLPAGSSFSVPGVQANQGMFNTKDIGDSEVLLPVGSVRRYLGLDDQGRLLFDYVGDYNRNFEVGGNKSLPTDDSMLSTESGKTLVKDDRYRDVRKKLGGSVMKRLAKILDEN